MHLFRNKTPNRFKKNLTKRKTHQKSHPENKKHQYIYEEQKRKKIHLLIITNTPTQTKTNTSIAPHPISCISLLPGVRCISNERCEGMKSMGETCIMGDGHDSVKKYSV